MTRDPAEALAVEEACTVLLDGGTLSGITREWTDAGVRPAQSKTGRWTRQSIRTILLNPRIAGLSVYRGEIVSKGEWELLVAEETWRALRGILDDPARKPPHGVRTLLGGLALCPGGNVLTGQPSHTGITCTGAPRPAASRPRPCGAAGRPGGGLHRADGDRRLAHRRPAGPGTVARPVER